MKAKLTEAEFTRMVLELAKLCGWRTAHFRPARTAKGWRTAVQGDGKGFPDLVLVNERRALIFFVELKTNAGDLTDEQQAWQKAINQTGGTARVWRPQDWHEIERVLKGE